MKDELFDDLVGSVKEAGAWLLEQTLFSLLFCPKCWTIKRVINALSAPSPGRKVAFVRWHFL